MLIELAVPNDAILYRLPSYTPLDVSVFKQLKSVWRNELKAQLRFFTGIFPLNSDVINQEC